MDRRAAVFDIALLFLKVILPKRYLSPSSMGMVISTAFPGPDWIRGMWNPWCPVSWILVFASATFALKYPRFWYSARTRSVSSSSLVASYVRANRFSRKMEWGIPTGFRFFIAERKTRLLMLWLP